MQLGYLFSGQGGQFPDMGQDLYRQEPRYRQVISAASSALSVDLADPQISNDPRYLQASIVAMSTGIFKILTAELPLPLAASGLSLGEYSGLIASQMLSLEAGIRLVDDRSRYMTLAGTQQPGKLVALPKMTDMALLDQALKVGQQQGIVTVANYNTRKQVVIGGTIAGVDAASAFLKDNGAKRIIPLDVNAASHTPLMAPASELLKKRLASVVSHSAAFPVISNTTKLPFTPETLPQTLCQQLVQPTYFRDCLQQLAALGVTTTIELGPGHALTGFAKKTLPDITAWHIDSLETLNEVRQKVGK